MKELMKLTLEDIVKTAKFIGTPSDAMIIDEELAVVKEYPSNYNLGSLLMAIAESLRNN